MKSTAVHVWMVVFAGILVIGNPVYAQIAPPPEEEAVEPPPAPRLTKAPELKAFVEAVYPPEALEAGLAGEVRLQLDIDATGSVVAAVVTSGLSPELDESAVNAARQFEFTPAEVDGVPAPIRLEYVYTFTLQAPPEPLEPPEPELKVRGRLLEKGTRTPVVATSVEIPALGLVDVTDGEGRFAFFDIPASVVEIVVPATGYLRKAQEIGIAEEGVTEVTIRLEVDPYADFKSVVRTPSNQPVKRSLTTQELQKIPGSQGDALKALLNLPSVARPPGGAGFLVVRGSNPQDTAYRLDDLFIPALYHFGGIYSVFNTDLLESIDFYPGGFSVMHGNATAGLVDVKIKEAPRDRWRGHVDVNVFHAAAFAEGPAWEGGSLTFAARRSYIDAILPAVLPEDGTLKFTTAPAYYDYQLKLDQDLGSSDSLRVMIYGSDDQLRLVFGDESGDTPQFLRDGIENNTWFHFMAVRHEHVFSDTLRLVSSLNLGLQHLGFSLGKIIDFDLDLIRNGWREDFTWQPMKAFKLRFGLDVEYVLGDIAITAPLAQPQEGSQPPPLETLTSTRRETSNTYGRRGFYTEAIVEPLDGLTLTGGIRLDWYGAAYREVTLDPRFSLRWQGGETTALKGGLGLYHRQPDFGELDEVFGNPNLVPEESMQYSLGVVQEFGEGLSIDLQGFYKEIDDLVTENTDPFAEYGRNNAGIGRVYGGEVLLRQQYGGWFWGWISYTLSRSERKSDPAEDFRLFDFDQTHVLTLIASAKLPWELEFGVRFRYVTGNPETPVVGAVFDADSGVHVPQYGETISTRVPAFPQLDVRLAQNWLFQEWQLLAYIEVQNAYNRSNPEGLEYNYDYTESATVGGLPIIPGFGVKASF